MSNTMVMRKKIFYIIFTMILLGMGQPNAYSQLSQSNTKAQTDILLINDLMENNRYIAAQELISSMDKSKLTEQQIQELDYYNALASLKLDLHESAGLVEEFESKHPDYSRLETLKKAKGDYYFKHKKYKQAVREYVHVNSKNLVDDDKLSYFFKIGYSYFMTKNPTKASSYLYKVKDSKSSYAPSATYYYAHINYENKNYPSALKGFIMLEDDRAFKSIVPYYICQIYYKQEEYDKLIEKAPKLFEEASGTRKNEIAKLVGDASSVGLVYLLTFIAFISVNLAVINLIPLPALDGGRLLFIGIEALIRRPMNQKIMTTLNIIGFSFLLLLMVVITYHDIVKLLF